ncbi:unnamed protein product [Symbiodinium sp. KB8]|nr:unnamed protein product [Symbiodinium sp. KB8]
MTQPLVEQTWEVWLVLRLAALGASVLGSSWLLRATCKQPTVYLFNCQLRHLALADLCLSLVDPGYELAVWAIWPVGAGLPPLFNICCRGLFHALLCVVCFVEAQIAAGVMGSALHSQRCFSLLAKLLVFAWPAAAAVGAVDAVAMHLHTEGQRAFGFTKVLEVVLFTNFLLTLLMYLTSLVAVLRTPSPSAVVRRASLRALAYPCGFLITAFPDWLLYIRVIPENVWSGRLASLAMYSNGWVNAAVYGCQNRHLCPGSRLTTPGLALQGRRGSSPSSPLPLLPSFHVGFRVGDSRSFLQTVSSEDPCAEEETGAAKEPGTADSAEAIRFEFRMLLWEYLYWTDFTIPVEPINWEISREAEWQRRTALGFFQAAAPTDSAIRLRCCGEDRQAMGELFCCTSSSVDAGELRL